MTNRPRRSRALAVLAATLALSCQRDDETSATGATVSDATSDASTSSTSAASGTSGDTSTAADTSSSGATTHEPGLPFDPVDPDPQMCEGASPSQIDIVSAVIAGHDLDVSFNMINGCGSEWTALCWDRMLVDGDPVTATLGIGYAFTNPQGCATGGADLVMRTFKLDALAKVYADTYGAANGTVEITLGDYPEPLTYSF